MIKNFDRYCRSYTINSFLKTKGKKVLCHGYIYSTNLTRAMSDELLPTAIPAERLSMLVSAKKCSTPTSMESSSIWSAFDEMKRLEQEDEIRRIEGEERFLLQERAAIEKKRKELADKKTCIKAEIKTNEQEKSKHLKVYDDILALETAREKIPTASNLSSEILLAREIDQDFRRTHDREIAGFLMLAKTRQMKRKHYINLASLLFFFVMYSTAMLIQRDILSAFDFESRSGTLSYIF